MHSTLEFRRTPSTIRIRRVKDEAILHRKNLIISRVRMSEVKVMSIKVAANRSKAEEGLKIFNTQSLQIVLMKCFSKLSEFLHHMGKFEE